MATPRKTPTTTRLPSIVESYTASVCQRIRPQLDMNHGTDLGLYEAHGIVPVIQPQPATLPSCIRIVDSTVQTTVIQAERIWHAHDGEALFHWVEDDQRIGIGARQNDTVAAEAQRVELIDKD